MARLTDTQLVILSSASRRDDRGVDLPTNVTGEALREAVDKLIRTGLLDEVRANGSLLAWRRDAEAGPFRAARVEVNFCGVLETGEYGSRRHCRRRPRSLAAAQKTLRSRGKPDTPG